jgi:mannose-6-phosphate isomerase-like protein (cupin superfamily)
MTELIQKHWAPLDIFRVNDYAVRLVKIQGKYIWHKHNSDELFLVQKGSMIIHFKNQDVELREGEGYIVKEGRVHQTEAKQETLILVFERENVETIKVK